jgi:hypothetical protein
MKVKGLVLGICIVLITLSCVAIAYADEQQLSSQNIQDSNKGVISSISRTGQQSLYEELGVAEPNSAGAPSLQNYNKSKATVDKILTALNLKYSDNDIIGYYYYQQGHIILIQSGSNIQEIFWDGKTTTMYNLEPTVLGKKTVSIEPFVKNMKGNYTHSYSTTEVLKTYTIQTPDSASAFTLPSKNVARNDYVRDPINQALIAHLTTEADFYYDYGKTVSSIIDKSTYDTGTGWSVCSFTGTKSGEGSYAAQLKTYLKVGVPFFKAEINAWISCDAEANGNGGGVGSLAPTLLPTPCL